MGIEGLRVANGPLPLWKYWKKNPGIYKQSLLGEEGQKDSELWKGKNANGEIQDPARQTRTTKEKAYNPYHPNTQKNLLKKLYLTPLRTEGSLELGILGTTQNCQRIDKSSLTLYKVTIKKTSEKKFQLMKISSQNQTLNSRKQLHNTLNWNILKHLAIWEKTKTKTTLKEPREYPPEDSWEIY